MNRYRWLTWAGISAAHCAVFLEVAWLITWTAHWLSAGMLLRGMQRNRMRSAWWEVGVVLGSVVNQAVLLCSLALQLHGRIWRWDDVISCGWPMPGVLREMVQPGNAAGHLPHEISVESGLWAYCFNHLMWSAVTCLAMEMLWRVGWRSAVRVSVATVAVLAIFMAPWNLCMGVLSIAHGS